MRPVKELVGYTRVYLEAGESRRAEIRISPDSLCYYSIAMEYGLHNGRHTLLLGTSSDDCSAVSEIEVKDGIITVK